MAASASFGAAYWQEEGSYRSFGECASDASRCGMAMPLSLLPCPSLAPLVPGTSIFVKFAGMGGYYARIVTGIISAETFTAIGPVGTTDDHYVHLVDSIDAVIAAGAQG